MNNPGDTCRLCGFANTEIRYFFSNCRLASCSACGFLQTEAFSSGELASLYTASYFNKGKYVDDQAVYREQTRRLNFLKRAGVSFGSRILDAGCATGDFLAAGQAHYEMWGQDISRYAVETARTRLPEISSHIRTASLDCLNYPQAFFDAIVLWDVLEHVHDPVSRLADLSNILRPGGHLFVSTPDAGAFTARFMGRHWAFLTPPEHLCLFSKYTLRRLFTVSGLSPLFFQSLGKWVNLIFFIQKLNHLYPSLHLDMVTNFVKSTFLGKCILYIPTADVLYSAAIKNDTIDKD